MNCLSRHVLNEVDSKKVRLPFEGTSPSLNGGWKSEVKPQNGPLKSESENKTIEINDF